MKVNATSPMFKGGAISISRKNNPVRELLYNEVIDLVKKHKIGAMVRTKQIEIPSPSKAFKDELTQIGIKFDKMA